MKAGEHSDPGRRYRVTTGAMTEASLLSRRGSQQEQWAEVAHMVALNRRPSSCREARVVAITGATLVLG